VKIQSRKRCHQIPRIRPFGVWSDYGCRDIKEPMDKLAVFGFLIVATTLEASGDAVVRMGLASHAWPIRCLIFLGGAVLLFSYGLALNLAPIEFGRVVGLYVAILFIVWQIVNFVVFRAVPDAPTLVGGSLIVAGGCTVALWQR
jgi:hypothetical protein